jgi:putative DNA primase/helicase
MTHPYLMAKGIKAHGARLIFADAARRGAPNLSPELTGLLLVIPMMADGKLQCLQFITADGVKRPLTGGRKKGCYCPITKDKSKPDGTLCIAEGFATGASIHEATGYAVAVAFDAGNLLPVAQALRAKFPDIRLVLCADDDWRTDGNPGLTKAQEAAAAVGNDCRHRENAKSIHAVTLVSSCRPNRRRLKISLCRRFRIKLRQQKLQGIQR